MTTTFVRAACPHDCPDTCAMIVTVEDGRAVKVHGDPEHPTTHGSLCTKVSRELWPFYVAMCSALLIVTYVPAFSLWLPHLLAR